MIKISIEYLINTSPKLLWDRISTASGLSDWFADDVNIKGDKYTFFWDKSEQVATLISSKKEKYVRFKWAEDEVKYFEINILTDKLTNQTSLSIIDFAEDVSEEKDVNNMWNNLINKLKRSIGS